jgi:hypothetical protein
VKTLLALLALALCLSAPSFGADVVGHSVKAAGKVTYQSCEGYWQGGQSGLEVPFLT